MKRILAIALWSAAALGGGLNAQEITGRALLAFEHYDSNALKNSGFRQTYDLRLDRAFTDTARFSVFFRGDDFNAQQRFRQLQPGAELALNLETISILARSEYFDTRLRTGSRESSRMLQRSSGNLTWTPIGLPALRLLGQHNRTTDDAASTRLTDDNALAALSYEWRGLGGVAEQHYSRSTDPVAGYDRKSTYHNANLTYAVAPFGGKLAIAADASSQMMKLDETALAGASSVPTPVIIANALYAIDETPLDSRDHPPVANPALTDSDLNRNAGISLGPDAVSFQNITLDIGHIDRLDEVRVIVRDAAGNPLRNGGGPVSFDVYQSQDGDIWTSVASQTTFNAPLSLYDVSFQQVSGRWLKVVNFGVNAEATFVTEVQGFYHTALRPGEHRRGDQSGLSTNATITYRPLQRLLLSYTGLYSSIRQQLGSTPETKTSDLEHLGSIEYDIAKAWSVRTQYLQRDVQNFARAGDGARGLTVFLDFAPTKQLRITLESGDQRQTIDGTSFTMQTRAIHTTAYVLKSLFFTLDGGTQMQKISDTGSIARQQFINLTGNAQLWPTVRLQLNGAMQRVTADSSDPAVQLLGPSRDNRLSGDVIWRPGRQLQLTVRTGWVSGAELSGFTHRYHVEWFPFGDGTVSLGGSFDEDIDPTLNRRATRTVFNPRWLMNRFITFDLNYTSVKSSYQTIATYQKTLFATVTLSR